MFETFRATIPESILNLPATLSSGQSFRWRESSDGAWIGVVGEEVWRLKRERDDVVVGIVPSDRSFSSSPIGGALFQKRLLSYFRLDLDLNLAIGNWSNSHSKVREAVETFPGLRVIRQPAHDAMLSFACASANHVSRITRSLELLARQFGEFIANVDGVDRFALPSWSRLAALDPVVLWRKADLGYRGKVLHDLGSILACRPNNWLDSLADIPYAEAHREIAALPGIGPKIADCVCLYGLGHDQAIPVDSHIWAIAHELFEGQIPTKSLTTATYRAVADLYREAFPQAPGWAQHYLFHQRRLARKANLRGDSSRTVQTKLISVNA